MYRKASVSALFLLGMFISSFAAAQQGPSEDRIYRSLERPPNAITPDGRGVYSMDEVIQDRNLRHSAPSFDVRTINFAFGSAVIPLSERWKVEPLARAIHRFVRRNPGERFLLEGHTDAVGTRFANRELSQARADALMATLTHYFLVPQFAITAVGYGSSDPVVNVSGPEVKNRRVTLRRVTALVNPGYRDTARYAPRRDRREFDARPQRRQQPQRYRFQNLVNPPVPDIKPDTPDADVALAVPPKQQVPEGPQAPKSKPEEAKKPVEQGVAPAADGVVPEKEIRKIPIGPKQPETALPAEPRAKEPAEGKKGPFIDL